MINDYKSIEEAEQAWKSADWAFSRTYFKRPGEAAVCREGQRFFIITHPECVRYRRSINQIVKPL